MPPRRRPPRPGALTELPPLKIVRKILLLQALYYVCLTVLVLFTTLVAGTVFSLDLIFGWASLRGDTTVGWMLGLVLILNSFLCVIFLLIFVSRSKLIPDFALTIHFIHLIVVLFYTHSLPRNLLWWSLQIVSSVLMTFVGIWACQRRELQPITFGLGLGLGGAGDSNATGDNSSSTGDGGTAGSSTHPNAQAGDEDLENGGGLSSYGRGRGRGRNRDGRGERFEMVPFKEADGQTT